MKRQNIMDLGSNHIAPSILAGDHSNLESGVLTIQKHGAKWVHLDIMDGHFVPNLTFGPQTVADLRKKSDLFFDVHLMLDRPDKYVDSFIHAGADLVSVHVEPDYDISGTLAYIRSKQCYNGIVLNPDTNIDKVIPFLAEVDLVLQMTVFPGFGGQAFIDDTLSNITQLDAFRKKNKFNYRIEVDGGVDRNTIQKVKKAGADTFVSGSAFFRDENKDDFVKLFLSKDF